MKSINNLRRLLTLYKQIRKLLENRLRMEANLPPDHQSGEIRSNYLYQLEMIEVEIHKVKIRLEEFIV